MIIASSYPPCSLPLPLLYLYFTRFPGQRIIGITARASSRIILGGAQKFLRERLYHLYKDTPCLQLEG